MTSSPRAPLTTLAIVAAALAVTAAWLWFGPAIAAAVAGSAAGALPEALFTVVVFAPLLAFALGGGALSGVAAWRPGDQPIAASGRGLALGLGGLLLAAGYAALAGTLARGAGGGGSVVLLAGVTVIALQVAAEEALFRGWLQPLLAQMTGPAIAIGAIALAFVALHMLAGITGAAALINLTLGGLLFGVLAARDGGIAGAFAAHFAWNAAEQIGLGLDPNPGIGSFGAIVDLDLVGNVRWGGSSDGLNASWAMTIALAALVVPVILLWADRRRTARGSSASNPAPRLSPSPRRPT